MPVRTANRGDTVQYRLASGETRNVVVSGVQVAAPGIPASSQSTAGTLADATYSYRVSAVVDGVESAASAAKSQVVAGGSNTASVIVDFTAVANARATSHKIYGRTGGSELLMATVNMPTVTFTDTGAVTPAGALPAADGRVRLWDPYTGPSAGTILKATSYKQTGRYFLR